MVTSLVSQWLWRQYRAAELEGSERARSQAQWILSGAADWAMLILGDDARQDRANNRRVDYAGEPWAVPLRELRLNDFLSLQNESATSEEGVTLQAANNEVLEAFLSGQIHDAQARLNLRNLVPSTPGAGSTAARQPDSATLKIFLALVQSVGQDAALAQRFAERLLAADPASSNSNGNTNGGTEENLSDRTPLWPERYDDLAMLGADFLPPDFWPSLSAYVTWLPEPTPINLNTASELVLLAALPRARASDLRSLVQQRDAAPLRDLSEVQKYLPRTVQPNDLDARLLSVNSRYFEIEGQLRLDRTLFRATFLIERPAEGGAPRLLWRNWQSALLAKSAQ